MPLSLPALSLRSAVPTTPAPGRGRATSASLDLAALACAVVAASGRMAPWAPIAYLAVISGGFVRRGGQPTLRRTLALTAGLMASAILGPGAGGGSDNLVLISVLLAVGLAFAAMAEIGERRRQQQDRDQARLQGLLVAVDDIGAESDVASMLATVSSTAAWLLSAGPAAPVIARVVRIDRDAMVVVAEHGPDHPTVGARHPLTADPLVLATVTEDRTVTNAELYYRDVSPLPGAAGFGTRAASPIHVNGDVYGVLVVDFPGRDVSTRDIACLGGIAGITSLSVSNLIGAGPTGILPAVSADALTDLVNRRGFGDRIQSVGGAFAVLAVDVDRLKSINHTLGREAGDDALRAVARALTASVREDDVIARVGGDEFAILIEGAGAALAGAAAERVRAAVAELVGGPLRVHVSVGWAVGGLGDDGLAVWACADEALIRAKREGRNRVAGSAARRSNGTPGKGWNALISRVLASRQVNPVYQPIVRLRDQRVIAYEGLARPEPLEAGDSVEDLFATAHQLGAVHELDWICRRAVVQGAEGLRSDAVLYCNIDLSAAEDPDQDVDKMLTLLSWAGRDPGDIVLEVTDADRFGSIEQLDTAIEAYRRFGFRIAIDDAGRNGLGVDILHAVRPDVIKIDGAITNRCFDREARAFILEAVALADQTGAEVVAEGIEDQQIADELSRLGVDHGQGYLFGRPGRLPGPGPERRNQPLVLRAVAQER